jgi:hypothetical protein
MYDYIQLEIWMNIVQGRMKITLSPMTSGLLQADYVQSLLLEYLPITWTNGIIADLEV